MRDFFFSSQEIHSDFLNENIHTFIYKNHGSAVPKITKQLQSLRLSNVNQTKIKGASPKLKTGDKREKMASQP